MQENSSLQIWNQNKWFYFIFGDYYDITDGAYVYMSEQEKILLIVAWQSIGKTGKTIYLRYNLKKKKWYEFISSSLDCKLNSSGEGGGAVNDLPRKSVVKFAAFYLDLNTKFVYLYA